MTRARPDSRTVDLLLWAEIDDARRDLERAEAARAAAQRKYLYAPVGTKQSRLKAFISATDDALKATGTLRRLEREAGL